MRRCQYMNESWEEIWSYTLVKMPARLCRALCLWCCVRCPQGVEPKRLLLFGRILRRSLSHNPRLCGNSNRGASQNSNGPDSEFVWTYGWMVAWHTRQLLEATICIPAPGANKLLELIIFFNPMQRHNLQREHYKRTRILSSACWSGRNSKATQLTVRQSLRFHAQHNNPTGWSATLIFRCSLLHTSAPTCDDMFRFT